MPHVFGMTTRLEGFDVYADERVVRASVEMAGARVCSAYWCLGLLCMWVVRRAICAPGYSIYRVDVCLS